MDKFGVKIFLLEVLARVRSLIVYHTQRYLAVNFGTAPVSSNAKNGVLFYFARLPARKAGGSLTVAWREIKAAGDGERRRARKRKRQWCIVRQEHGAAAWCTHRIRF